MRDSTRLRGSALVLAAAALSVSCSGDDGGSSSTAGADRALAQRECYLGLQVPGVRHTGYACSGSSASSSVSGLKPNAFEPALSLSLALAEPPAIGDLRLTSLTVGIPQGETTHNWHAQVDSCSAVATDSAIDSDFDWTYFRIDISCTEPALPDDANPGEPLSLGDFSIVTFFSAD